MKKLALFTAIAIISNMAKTQTLTLVTGKKLYEHHSSALSNAPYGYANSNSKSGYDFVNHTNVPSGVSSMAPNRDMVEHNGYFSWNGSSYGWKFGFTSQTSNIGNFAYQGNNQTKFYLNNAVSFASLNTVNDLIAAYNSTAAVKFDTAVAAGNIYIVKVRNTDMYLAMRITSVTNLTAAEVNALDANQQVTASVFFEFEYKYGTLCTDALLNVVSSNSNICAGEQATLTATGASTFSWSSGSTNAEEIVSPGTTTTYTVIGTTGECVMHQTLVQNVSACTGIKSWEASPDLRIYPNPFENTLHLLAASGNSVYMTDVLGLVVYSGRVSADGEVLIDTEKFTPGAYIISVTDENRIQKRKLIKE